MGAGHETDMAESLRVSRRVEVKPSLSNWRCSILGRMIDRTLVCPGEHWNGGEDGRYLLGVKSRS